MKKIVLVVAGCLAGCILTLGILPRYMLYSHRKSVAQYAEYVHGLAEGIGSVSEMPPDPIVSLAFLVQAGELYHLDVTFPSVPASSKEASEIWRKFVREDKGVVCSYANHSSQIFPEGEQVFHLNIWFRPSSKDGVRDLVKEIESSNK